MAIQHAQAAREGEAHAQAATSKALQRGEDAVAAQRAINEKQRNKLAAAVAETEEWKHKVAQVSAQHIKMSGWARNSRVACLCKWHSLHSLQHRPEVL